MSYRISEINIMYEKEPMGLDEPWPVISWKFKSEESDMKQTSVRIQVGTEKGGNDLWDSASLTTDCSIGIRYAGKGLKPCTIYYVTVETKNQKQEIATAETWFETGLLDHTMEAWNGAQWIGAPEYSVSSDTIGVFVLESTITLSEGSTRAGVVFGANDERLLHRERNEYLIQGENYIRYEINVGQEPATLDIYRVGYHKDDRADQPLVSVPIVNFDGEITKPVIEEASKYQPHTLRIEVIGNSAYTYIDQLLVDAELRKSFFGESVEARQLNPMGSNDITAFPRLCDIGYFTAKGSKAHFSGIKVSNYRSPGKVFYKMDTEQGIDIEGTTEDVQLVKNPDCHGLPMLRRDFTATKPIRKARLYATARGIYDCRINGREISDQFFAPGASQFDKHLMYQTYDVTEIVKQGENGIGFTLASGWWSDAQTFTVRNYNFWGDKVSLLAKLVLYYEDGTNEIFGTNTEEWQYFGEGPYRYASFFQGEHYDANLAELFEAFSKPGFFVEGFKKPLVISPDPIEAFSTMPPGFGEPWPAVNKTEPRLTGSVNAPVKVVEVLTAQAMSEPAPGVYIYDLGQEIAGVPVLKLKGFKGTRVRIRYGEMLYPDLPEYGELYGRMLQVNLRDASSTDIYILRGDEMGELYQPKFTFHGYRYIEITGLEQAPALSEVQSLQLSSIPEITGSLRVDHDLVNRFIRNVKYSQLSNFISIPTDCPQRNERMGWTGDGHVFCRTATYQSDARLFYYRYLQAIVDLQKEDGSLPNIAPVGGGFGGITYGSALILMAWELYQQYGDTDVVRKYYPAMKRWMELMKKAGMPGDAFVGPLGDWLAPEETDNHLIWNAFYGRDAQLMQRFAELLEYRAEAETFAAIAADTKKYWNETFVDTSTGKTKKSDGTFNDTQCSYALGLSYDMFDQHNRRKAFDHLARKTKEVGCTVSTGFFGTGPLNPMLSEGGYDELAYALITQTAFPSWLYPVTQGATTIWERWDSYTVERGFGGQNAMNSFNHYSLGSVLSWMYEYVLGIQRDETTPGYKHFVLMPSFTGFQFAEGGFETPHGRIESSYVIKDGSIEYSCRIPANTTATLKLKDKEYELGSGSYQFMIEV